MIDEPVFADGDANALRLLPARSVGVHRSNGREAEVGTTFADRLNRLFDAVCPPGRGPYTSAEVIAALRAQGVVISAPYLSQLRSGQRANPSSNTRVSLAGFFGVEAAYFTDDEYYERVDQELQWLLLVKDEDIRTMATEFAALSPKDRQKVQTHLARLRRDSPTG